MTFKLDDVMTLFIFVLGLFTVALSIIAAVKFHRYTKGLVGRSKMLSRAISWQLWGEAAIGLGTLIFAFAAFTGALDHWSTSLQSSIRFTMFLATSATTYHLVATLKRL